MFVFKIGGRQEVEQDAILKCVLTFQKPYCTGHLPKLSCRCQVRPAHLLFPLPEESQPLLGPCDRAQSTSPL